MTTVRATTVALVDDDEDVCGYLARIVGREPDLRVVGTRHDADGGLHLLRLEEPDVALVDARMPGGGLEVVAACRAESLPTRVVILTNYADRGVLHRAVRAGASGFLLKSTAPEHLVQSIRLASAGYEVLPAGTAGHASVRLSRASTVDDPGDAGLTTREHDVLACLSRGMSNGEIAAALSLSQATVKGHVSRLMDKLGCTSRLQVAVTAIRRGIADADVAGATT